MHQPQLDDYIDYVSIFNINTVNTTRELKVCINVFLSLWGLYRPQQVEVIVRLSLVRYRFNLVFYAGFLLQRIVHKVLSHAMSIRKWIKFSSGIIVSNVFRVPCHSKIHCKTRRNELKPLNKFCSRNSSEKVGFIFQIIWCIFTTYVTRKFPSDASKNKNISLT